MKNKKYYIIEENDIEELLKNLVKNENLPKINSILNIYFVKNNEYLYRLFFKNSKVFFQKNTLAKKYKNIFNFFESDKKIELKNKNIKLFLNLIFDPEVSTFIGKELVEIDFNNEINLKLNTPIGNILKIPAKKINKYKNFLNKEINKKEITKKFFENSRLENIFDRLGNLNEKLVDYGDKFGIDLSELNSISINSKLRKKSNNYFLYEEIYHKIFNEDLNPKLSLTQREKRYFKPLSIIIPSYNSENTILKLLYAIQSQDILEKDKKELDVIIIDDGSKIPVKEIIENSKIEKELSFKIRIFRNETNQGLSTARNIGMTVSKKEYLLFMDSDILLSKNYLLEHSILLQLFPQSLFFSLKKNIKNNDKNFSIENIKKGLESPDIFDDKRIKRNFKTNQLWINPVDSDGEVEILSETKNLKEFGYYRRINGYDLPSIVVGHNFSISKDNLRKFSLEFSGWGLEDTLFGAMFIAEGGFIIPALNTGVYHIDHPPRSGSLKKQKEEYMKNLKIYKDIIKRENYE